MEPISDANGHPNQALEEALRQTDKEISELELKEQSPGRKSLRKMWVNRLTLDTSYSML